MSLQVRKEKQEETKDVENMTEIEDMWFCSHIGE